MVLCMPMIIHAKNAASCQITFNTQKVYETRIELNNMNATIFGLVPDKANFDKKTKDCYLGYVIYSKLQKSVFFSSNYLISSNYSYLMMVMICLLTVV